MRPSDSSGRTAVDPPDTLRRRPIVPACIWRAMGYVTLSIDLLTDGEARGTRRRGAGKHRTLLRAIPNGPSSARIPGTSCAAWISSSPSTLSIPGTSAASASSLGGHTALFAGAFDPRIAATISIGGVLDWHRPTESWARSKGKYVYIKKVSPLHRRSPKARAGGF